MAANAPNVQEDSRPDAEEMFSCIGGSEAFELLGEKQYERGCARALGYRKLRTPKDVEHVSAEDRAMRMGAIFSRGHILEDVAAQLFMQATGRAVIRRKRLVRHPDHPGAGVHTDRIILAHRILGQNVDETRPTGDCEIKTHGEGPFFHILRNGLPPAHNLQLQWSMFCTQHVWGSFVILGVFGGLPLRYFDVERDAALMNIFADAVENFWNTLKAGDLPPQLPEANDIRCKVCPYRLTCRGEALDPEEYLHLLKDRERKIPLVRIKNEELDEALGDRALILSEKEALEESLELVMARIRELLGDEDAAEVSDRWRIYQTEGAWSGLDQQRLRTEEPEIFKKFYISQRPTGKKRMRVYAIGEKRSA